jgi:hypothetical protein
VEAHCSYKGAKAWLKNTGGKIYYNQKKPKELKLKHWEKLIHGSGAKESV